MIDYSQSALPKVRRRSSVSVKLMRDGREVCRDTSQGRREYKRRKLLIHKLYNGYCVIGFHPMTAEEVTAEHRNGRGLAGGRRSDRVEDGSIVPACLACNYSKGSSRIPGLEEQAMSLLATALEREDYLSEEEKALARQILRHLESEAA